MSMLLLMAALKAQASLLSRPLKMLATLFNSSTAMTGKDATSKCAKIGLLVLLQEALAAVEALVAEALVEALVVAVASPEVAVDMVEASEAVVADLEEVQVLEDPEVVMMQTSVHLTRQIPLRITLAPAVNRARPSTSAM
jgi:hypothetical protein